MFPAIKTIEELDVTHLRGLTRQQLSHLGTLEFKAAKENAIFLGPPGTGKTHLATGLAARACQAGRLQDELVKLGRYPLTVTDEVGYKGQSPP